MAIALFRPYRLAAWREHPSGTTTAPRRRDRATPRSDRSVDRARDRKGRRRDTHKSCRDGARSHAPGAWRRLHEWRASARKLRRWPVTSASTTYVGSTTTITSPSRATPTFIILDSHIGYGSPHKQDIAAAHGEALAPKSSACASGAMGGPRMRSSSSPTDGIETTRERIPPAIIRHGNTRTACCRHM